MARAVGAPVKSRPLEQPPAVQERRLPRLLAAYTVGPSATIAIAGDPEVHAKVGPLPQPSRGHARRSSVFLSPKYTVVAFTATSVGDRELAQSTVGPPAEHPSV